MKAARLHALGEPLAVEDIPVPEATAGSVLVQVEAAFVPSFIAAIAAGSGYSLPPLPFTPGVDAVGFVERVGPGVDGPAPGTRVYCNPFYAPDRPGEAAARVFIGSFALGANSLPLFERWGDGACAEKIVLPRECVVPIPSEVAAPAAVLCRLGWLGTAHAAFRKAGFGVGEVVIVHGATGLLGSSATVLALALGARLVQVTGRDQDALDRLSALDSRIVVVRDPEQAEGASLLLSCVAGGNPQTLARLLPRLQIGGNCVVIGAPGSDLVVPPGRLLRDQIVIRGSLWHEAADVAALFDLVAAGRLDPSLFTPREFRLEQINKALPASNVRTDPLAHVALACS